MRTHHNKISIAHFSIQCFKHPDATPTTNDGIAITDVFGAPVDRLDIASKTTIWPISDDYFVHAHNTASPVEDPGWTRWSRLYDNSTPMRHLLLSSLHYDKVRCNATIQPWEVILLRHFHARDGQQSHESIIDSTPKIPSTDGDCHSSGKLNISLSSLFKPSINRRHRKIRSRKIPTLSLSHIRVQHVISVQSCKSAWFGTFGFRWCIRLARLDYLAYYECWSFRMI